MKNINVDNVITSAIRGITFGGSIGLDILEPFNSVARALPIPPTKIYGHGAQIIVPATDKVLLGAGQAKPEIATSQRFVVRVDAFIGEERARQLRGLLVNFFGDEVRSSCLDPIHVGGKLHYDVGVQLKLSQGVVDLAQELNAQLRRQLVVA